MKNKEDLSILASAILLKLYRHGLNVGGALRKEGIQKLFRIKITSTFIREALNKLEGEKEINNDMYGNFEINTKGIERIQRGLKDDSSLIFEISKNNDEWLDQDKPLLRDIFPEVGITESKSSDDDFPTYTHFKDSLLVVLAAKEEKEGPGYRDLKNVADEFGLKYRSGWVRKAAYSFRDAGYINQAFTMGGGEDGNLDAALTGAGLEAAEALKRSGNIASKSGVALQSIPASDRIVKLDDNKPARQKAVAAIQEVIAEAEESNEFGQLFADPNEKIIVLSEMKSGLAILRDETVARYSTIKNFIADRLTMIANKLPDIMLGEVAKKALEALGEWIKGLF